MQFLGSPKSPWVLAAFLCLLMSGLCCAQSDKIGNTINTQANVSINMGAYDTGLQAYLYFYPLVTLDITRRAMTNGENESQAIGPMNEFHHYRAYPPADDRSVVRINFDTLYSKAWLNLTDGPMIVSVPDTEGRYYLLPVLDMWTDVFASPGIHTHHRHNGRQFCHRTTVLEWHTTCGS
jgi:hypothetical protein